MKKWILKNKKADLESISKKYGIEKLLARILVNRDIEEDELNMFLNGTVEDLHSPSLMKDMDKATDLIMESISNDEKIRIVGDYDQDGVSSTVILMKTFKKIGNSIGKDLSVDFKIPDRMTDGYGINERIVEEAKNDGIDLIITCDNGIAAFEAVEKAKELGIKIIVTDHHDVPLVTDETGIKKEELIEADAVVNPKQAECSYPFDAICGATVAFKLCLNLYKRMGQDTSDLDELYQFAAMATVCDVVDLIDENRIIVRKGLEIINETDNLGLKMLIKETKIEGKKIVPYHLGFIIGPSINASGRLETANLSVELFLTENEREASEKAGFLVSLNEDRKEMTERGIEQTIEMIENSSIKDDDIIIAYNPDIHESIAGIIAGRIKDKYYKPTVVLTNSKDEGMIKGSGRSIDDYDMFEGLSEVKSLFDRFGGHPMAAGLSLKKANLEEFREQINRNSKLTEDELTEKIYIDAHLPVEGINMALPERLEMLEPFGKANRKPSFGDKDIRVSKIMILGKNYRIIKMNLVKNGKNICDAVYFGDIEKFQDYMIGKFGEDEVEKAFNGLQNDISLDLIYYPNINEYMGKRNLQIVISDYR